MLGFMEVLDTAEEKLKFEELYRKYRSPMYAVAWKILHNERNAEDIVHDSFRAIIENFDKINDISCQKTWNYIVTIVKNKSFTLYNAKKDHGTAVLEDWTETKNDFDVEKTVETKEVADIMAEAIIQLPYPYKEVLYLQFYNKMSGAQIAEALEKTPENIRKISQRAKAMLREKLLERGLEMNRDFLTDELLEEAIRKACEQEYSMLDDVEEHEFSSEFEQEMEALINEKENKPIPFRRKRKIKFRYLLVAILSFALSYATVLAVEPAGEKIAGYMEKLRNNGVAYKTVETESNDVIAPNLIFFKYFPKEITKQEEFLYKYVDENNAICVLNFSGENNASLTCVKATPVFWDVYEFNIDWDSAIAQDISVAGYPAVLVTESSGRENIIYVRGGQVFMAGGTVGRDELVKVLESIDMFQ